MNKKTVLVVSLTTIILIGVVAISVPLIKKKAEEEKIKNAKIIVELKEDLTIPFGEKRHVSDFIENINGTIEKDYEIASSRLGENTVKFSYTNEEGIKIPYEYKVSIVDVTPPVIWLGSSYTITTSFTGKIEDKIMCIDDLDDNPNCYIEGDYDTKTPGTYNLHYIGEDASGNIKDWPFTLTVKKPSTSNGGGSSTRKQIEISDVITKYKNEKTRIGIDVSEWQGNIDFEKVKNAGVEFAILRVGSKKGSEGEYFVDGKFKRNIEGFNKVGIPVGVYFYSYAKTNDESYRDALWVLKQIKGYEVSLPIAYDWENWANFKKYQTSMYHLTENARIFLDTIEAHGYKGMHYSSLSYLNSIWMETGYPIWLAHYTSKTSYDKPYKYWQFANNGHVDGIYGDVDLNIMYINEVNRDE